MRKNCSSDREKTFEGQEFAKFLRSLEQFLVTECFFNLLLEISQISKNRTIICNADWKKILGFRNLQEKLEKKE